MYFGQLQPEIKAVSLDLPSLSSHWNCPRPVGGGGCRIGLASEARVEMVKSELVLPPRGYGRDDR